jgi:hypothetical protein
MAAVHAWGAYLKFFANYRGRRDSQPSSRNHNLALYPGLRIPASKNWE